jgi:2-oxoisovalerate dehydrogenase E1 component alpha subunit
LIEFFTYRAEGHSTSDDPSGYRSAEEREEWPLGDPINRLKKHLVAIGEWDEERQEQLDAECVDLVKKTTKEAEKNGILGHGLHHPFHTMFEDVFEELPWHLKEQAEQAIHERETKFPEGLPKR